MKFTRSLVEFGSCPKLRVVVKRGGGGFNKSYKELVFHTEYKSSRLTPKYHVLLYSVTCVGSPTRFRNIVYNGYTVLLSGRCRF